MNNKENYWEFFQPSNEHFIDMSSIKVLFPQPVGKKNSQSSVIVVNNRRLIDDVPDMLLLLCSNSSPTKAKRNAKS